MKTKILKQVAMAGLPGLALTLALVVGCSRQAPRQTSYQGESSKAAAVIAQRNLKPDDVVRALQTYVAPGQHDPYLMFASGGQNGQVLVYGIPSM
ncbi:MAG TPA: hypothetical protein VGY98_06255, partial [Verrucomicrobiae bacterium]|nr:hypothetical protein [Verrucomicrobiae bacterium]